jgi:hypothetical protein
MRRKIFILVFLFPFLVPVKAQKGSNNIHIIAETGAADLYKPGFGGYVKGIYDMALEKTASLL